MFEYRFIKHSKLHLEILPRSLKGLRQPYKTMFHRQGVKVILVQILAFLALWPDYNDCLIITSVLAGDKKFKTISFHTKLLKPLTFEKELPTTEFRRHRTLRPPKFDIDVNIPIKLPLEDEYAQDVTKKPVTSNIFFETGEIVEPYGKKQQSYPNEPAYAASSNQLQQSTSELNTSPIGYAKNVAGINRQAPKQSPSTNSQSMLARSDVKEPQQQERSQQEMMTQESYANSGYAKPQNYGEYQQDFVPGGFVNLQLSGPTGGPKMTYADYDREKWAQQLSQAAGAMPYPILNYQQLQNFYGGLGTFTNGLAENRYMSHSILDKLKSGLHHFTSKIHFGRK